MGVNVYLYCQFRYFNIKIGSPNFEKLELVFDPIPIVVGHSSWEGDTPGGGYLLIVLGLMMVVILWGYFSVVLGWYGMI